MALTPISLFQSQGNGIAQFLQGGQNALASALNNVIQVGRDTANKQFSQERDFLSEQKRVEDLAQRRGENLQQQSNWDRTFARNLFVSDRDFADQNADQARQEERLSANDLFNRRESNRDFDLRKSEAERRAEERDMLMQKAEQQEQFDRDLLAPPQGSGAAPSRMSADFLYGPVAGTPSAPPMTGTTPGPTGSGVAESPEARLAQARIRAQAAQQVGDAKAFTSATMEAAQLEAELGRSGVSTEGMTPTQLMSLERLGISQRGEERTIAKEAEAKVEKAAEQERKQASAEITALVRADPKGFPPAGSFLPAETASDTPEIKRKREEAALLDQERETVEIRAALNSPNVEDYLGKAFDTEQASGGRWTSMSAEEKRALAVRQLGEAQVANRELLWNKAEKTGLGKRVQPKKKTAPAAPAPAAPAATPAPAATQAQQEIDRIRANAERNRQ